MRSRAELVKSLPAPLERAVRIVVGATGEHWVRVVMNRHISSHIASLGPDGLAAAEVGQQHAHDGWGTYTSLLYPDFDLVDDLEPPGPFDVVITEQVLEHVNDAVKAVGKLFAMTRPGGRLIVSTPFLIKIHEFPKDYWRFTPDGLRALLERAGFEAVEIHSWGNRSCVRRNFVYFKAYRPWHSLKNDPDFPVVVWAYARRPIQGAEPEASRAGNA